jgi:2-polyprenyl-3-methyl-5-hydroxy-6-metoxy-1,4-benzoquinol methylase
MASGLRAERATRLVGIEVDHHAAEQARRRYDRVVNGAAEVAVPELGETFDTLLCLDVLEHLIDPAGLLRSLHGVANDGTRLQVSVPNVRHVSVLRDLVARGTFGYTDTGIRDSTHLRWFTRGDMHDLLEQTGWQVTRVSHSALERWHRLHRGTRGRLAEFLVSQWYFLARPAAKM